MKISTLLENSIPREKQLKIVKAVRDEGMDILNWVEHAPNNQLDPDIIHTILITDFVLDDYSEESYSYLVKTLLPNNPSQQQKYIKYRTKCIKAHRTPWSAYDAASEHFSQTNQRDPKLEARFIHSPEVADQYARYVIKDRWPEAEPYIKQSRSFWNQYKKHFRA
jgi:hypothetical protein